jgi:hypothetical protein
LPEALKACRLQDAKLIIAKLDRFPQGLGPRQLHRLLQQGFEASEMGFNDKFAVVVALVLAAL